MIVALVLALALALGSFWVREVIRRGINESGAEAVRTDPDYFVDNFNFIKASKTGQAQYAITGVRLTHLPNDDSYEISLPVVKSLNVDKPTITAVSLRATANSDASKVEMFDNVHVDRPESKTAPDFHMKTDYLQIFPDDDAMQTDRAVHIAQGAAETSGVGMYANNATLTFKLFHDVQAVIQPNRH